VTLLRGMPGRAGRILSSPWLFLACLAPTLLLGAGLALWLQPEPHSDWGYYWRAAGEYQDYERGGVGLWLLAIPKALGLSPVASALSLNLLAAAVVLRVSWCADLRGARGLWLATAAYLFLISPYFGIVQLDLAAAASLGAGMWLAASAGAHSGRRGSLAIAFLLVVAGVSTRPQFALTLWTMLAVLAVPWLLWRKRAGPAASTLLGVLVVGSVLGFALDYGLRGLGDRDESIRTSSAVTLYGGLLVSGQGQGCGYWSLEAARAAKADLHKPLHRAAIDRLAEQPASHWAGVIRCKLPEILRPPPYATYWLVETPSVRAAIDADPRNAEINATYYRILGHERRLYWWLTMAMLVAVIGAAAVAMSRRKFVAGFLPIAWVLSFWLVHLIFEIQGRYFLGMFLLAPLLCALALALARIEPDDRDMPDGSAHSRG